MKGVFSRCFHASFTGVESQLLDKALVKGVPGSAGEQNIEPMGSEIPLIECSTPLAKCSAETSSTRLRPPTFQG